MTVWPRRSIVVVDGPASFLIAASVPTAVNRPPEIATACAIENRASTVMTWPLTRIVSGGARRLCRAERRRMRRPRSQLHRWCQPARGLS